MNPQGSELLSSADRGIVAKYFRSAYRDVAVSVDRMMVLLLAVEWIGMIGTALIVSPRTWNGEQSRLHPHLIAAVLAGPVFILPAIAVALMNPGKRLTRHVVAVAQMLVSILLIDVTGGRIETHFHVFGSLSFLACYRDWPVLVTATVITAVDHLVRGIWWPQSVYGIATASPWRWVEHAWWVVFEDFFLIWATRRSIREMWMVAAAKAHLHDGAYHDVLTGLANRRQLTEKFESKIAKAPESKMAVLFIDLDRFKQANDTLGHTVGDRLLTLVASRLSKHMTGGNTLARIGGDEFIALIERVRREEDARDVGLQLLRALAEPFEVDGHELLLSASVGISMWPDHGNDLPLLQERADKAMYAAKSNGRNQCMVFSQEMARHEEMMDAVARDLYKALPRNEFRLHFQPIVESDGEVAGFEALLRWNHPVFGDIPPSEFIPIAEGAGLMIALGDWVLEEAARHCASWQRRGERRVGVAVNLSPTQLEQPELADRILKVFRDAGIGPSLLTLEVTESVLIRDMGMARRHIAVLRAAGVRVALDDFGTGYSSLSYLATLPADVIKLDRSFMNRGGGDSPVIESILGLAHRLGLKVVAEGVETIAQKQRLVELQCDEMQGYYFGRPNDAASVQQILEARRRANEAAELMV